MKEREGTQMNTEHTLERLCEYKARVLDHTYRGTNLQIIEGDIQEIVFTPTFVPSSANNVIVMIKKLVEDYPPSSQIKRPLAAVCSFT